MVLDSDNTSVLDGTESTISGGKSRTKRKKPNSPYKTKTSMPKQLDVDKRREQWLKDLRSGNGRTMSGRPITGTIGTSGAVTSRSSKSVVSARSVKVTLNTDENDAALLSSSKFLQQKMLANMLLGGGDQISHSKSNKAFAPTSKDPGDMADEIVELKRKLAQVESTISVSKGRMRRLEEGNSRKDKQIEQLLNPNASDDTRRSLAERGDSSSVVNSLKNKNIRLELTLKEKENELRKLKEDVKTTRAEEMKICMEAFYQEIIRLRAAAVQTGKKTDFGTEGSTREQAPSAMDRKMKTLNANNLRLSEINKDLETENESLRTQLEALKDTLIRPESGEFEDMTRDQLLQVTHEIQQKLDRYDEIMRDEVDEEERSAVDGKIELKGSFAERFLALDKRETELLRHLEKSRSSLEKSREERDEWRRKYEELKKESSEIASGPSHSGKVLQRTSTGLDKEEVVHKTSVNELNISRVQERPEAAPEKSVQGRRKQDDDEWGKKSGFPAAEKKQTGTDEVDSGGTVKMRSDQYEIALQLQSLMRAHLTRCQGRSQSSASQQRPQSSSATTSASRRSNNVEKRQQDSDNESTARSQTARSNTHMEPISDRSEASSTWGDLLSSPKDTPDKTPRPRAHHLSEDATVTGASKKKTGRHKSYLESESESTVRGGETTEGVSESDETPRPFPRTMRNDRALDEFQGVF